MNLSLRVKYSILMLIVAPALLSICGCVIGTRTIIVPPSVPLILNETIENVKVLILDQESGELISGKATLWRGQDVLTLPLETKGK